MGSKSYPVGRSSPSPPWSPLSPSPSSPSEESPPSVGTCRTSSTSSLATAHPLAAPPQADTALRDLQDFLDQLRDQTRALWDGQVSTNHMLDDLRVRRADNTVNLNDRLDSVGGLL